MTEKKLQDENRRLLQEFADAARDLTVGQAIEKAMRDRDLLLRRRKETE